MAEAALFRRAVLRSQAAAISCLFPEANRFTHAASYSSLSSIAEERNPSNAGDERGKWLTLPPFAPTVDGPELGRKIAGRRMEAGSVADTPTTALKWVLRCCPQLPRSLVQKLFRLRQVRRECFDITEESVKAEGSKLRLKRVTAKDSMNQGDKIFLPITVVAPSPKKIQYSFNEEELDFINCLVLYKDSSIIAINKPPGLPVQGGVGIRMSLDEVAASCYKYDYSESPKLVHRLDRDCSGILVMGRTQTSSTVLHSVFHEKTAGASYDERDNGKRFLQKRYLALVFGSPRCLKGTIDVPLKKVLVDNGKSERITIGERSRSSQDSQHAVTEYRVIQTTPHGYTWLELSPLTGRKHQLRVHCAEVLRTPIVGDYKYGWQAHRQWRPFPGIQTSYANKFQTTHLVESGSITEKQPGLHLHCKQMVLPNISLALQQASEDADFDFSNLETVSLVAPLPWHMQRSWDILNTLPQQKPYLMGNEGECERTTTGWAAKDPSGILSPYTFNLRKTGKEDVYMKVICCGICHTDLHQIKNDLGQSNYPMVPGHEVVGEVLEVGSGVSKFKVGDRVGVGAVVGCCRKCHPCTTDEEQYCNKKIWNYNDVYTDGHPTQGGFAGEMVVDQKFVVKIPEGMESEQAAPLLCAGVTVYSPLKHFGLNKSGLRGGILGLGGVGHMGVLIAKAMGHQVVVISSSDKKKTEALDHLGADDYVVSSDADHMSKLADSLDYIIDTVPVVHPLEPYLSLLKLNGKLVLTGVIGTPLQFLTPLVMLQRRSITGSFIGSMKEMDEMLQFCKDKGVTSQIEVVKMDYINKAFERLDKNDVRYRFVVDVAGSQL